MIRGDLAFPDKIDGDDCGGDDDSDSGGGGDENVKEMEQQY